MTRCTRGGSRGPSGLVDNKINMTRRTTGGSRGPSGLVDNARRLKLWALGSSLGGNIITHCRMQLGNFQPSAWDKFSKDENGENFESPIILLVGLINPRSRGELKIQNSANKNNNKGNNCENGQLDINPAYLSEQSDLDRLVEGIIWIHQTLYYINEANQLTQSTVTTNEKPISIKLHLPRYSGCPQIPNVNSSKDFESIKFSKKLKAAVTCLAKSITLSNYHLVGTCSMKLPNAKFSPVVEDNFKLIGVNNVRIGDASVISKIPSSNPASLIMAIGNQLAKYVINEGWQ
ncbi:unnamed protein product [Trichobilharzia regenti]|nr:unnamed protein product [Trichobilharzia regenti]